MEDRSDHGGGPGENVPGSPARDVGGGPDENVPGSPAPEVGGEEEDEGGDGGGFTFPVPPVALDACVVPVYPIFGRPLSPPAVAAADEEAETATLRVPLGRLLLEEREFRAGQQRDGSAAPKLQPDDEEGELEGLPPESYCLWAPGQSAPASPRRCRKSGSTGSVLRWRRISERLVGRSHSDGKEKFVFLNTGSSGLPKQDEGDEVGGKSGAAARVGGRGWSYYGKGGGGGGTVGAGRRRSYLPYKQELVGLFANVNGLRRSYPPF